jgi:hypothetical protein
MIRPMNDPAVRTRMALGLTAIAFALILLPLLLNLLRGGAEGVGHDPRTQGSDLRFAVSYAETAGTGPLSGRLFVIVSRNGEVEPRLQVASGGREPYVVGRRVTAWRPGRPVELTDQDPGPSIPSLAHIPPGHYHVQGVFEPDRPRDPAPEGSADGSEDDPAATAWASRAGNLVSRPVELYVDPRSGHVLRVYLARTITASPPPEGAPRDDAAAPP